MPNLGNFYARISLHSLLDLRYRSKIRKDLRSSTKHGVVVRSITTPTLPRCARKLKSAKKNDTYISLLKNSEKIQSSKKRGKTGFVTLLTLFTFKKGRNALNALPALIRRPKTSWLSRYSPAIKPAPALSLLTMAVLLGGIFPRLFTSRPPTIKTLLNVFYINHTFGLDLPENHGIIK